MWMKINDYLLVLKKKKSHQETCHSHAPESTFVGTHFNQIHQNVLMVGHNVLVTRVI